MNFMELPEYTDGSFHLYRIDHDESSDFPVEVLEDQHMDFCFKEIAVFDRLRYEFGQGGKEITMKIRIPRYKKIDSKCAVKIDGEIHVVFNAAHVVDKNGFKETELTLIRPERELIVK